MQNAAWNIQKHGALTRESKEVYAETLDQLLTNSDKIDKNHRNFQATNCAAICVGLAYNSAAIYVSLANNSAAICVSLAKNSAAVCVSLANDHDNSAAI